MKRDHTTLGRPRSFDEDEALSNAMAVFWSNGFGGTSYPDLESATGLHRQSLRYAFGDKMQMFHSVVTRYAEQKVGSVLELLVKPSPKIENVRAVFALWASDANHPSKNGCLMVNALAELGGGDGVAVGAINEANTRLIHAFAIAFETAQRQGDVRPDLDPHSLASQAVALGDGFMLHGRSGTIAKFAQEGFDAFVAQIAT